MEPVRVCAEHTHAHAGARPRCARWITSHPSRPGRQQETAMEEEEKEEEKKEEKEEEAAFAASHSARGPRPRRAPPRPASPPRVPRGRPCGSGARGAGQRNRSPGSGARCGSGAPAADAGRFPGILAACGEHNGIDKRRRSLRGGSGERGPEEKEEWGMP